jgi:flagellar biosynthesis protein FlhB
MARADGDATEQPTPQRLLKARQRGQVAVSRDLSAGLALAALLAVFAGLAPVGLARLLGLFQRSLSTAAAAAGPSALGTAGWAAFQVAVPILSVPLSVVLAVAIVVGVVQTGGLFAWQAVGPDLGRLSPAVGLKRLFSGRTALEVGFGLFKVVLVTVVAAVSLWPSARQLPHLAGARPLGVITALGVLVERLGIRAALALVALGMIDWLLTRRRHHRALMMTRDEVRREHKEAEGDPRHRAERQRLHREIGEQRMIEDVRKADFIVVNPDHIAVAVKYDREADAAPVVIAKGERLLAERIKQVARESGVPIYRDLALARALNELPEGEEIPEALYEAVAELLRVLWEIDRPTGVAVETDSTRTSEDKAQGEAQGNAQDKSVPSTPATWKRV